MSRIGRVISIALVVVAAYSLTSCGNGLPHSNQISARITPAQATVASGGSVVLQATTSGFTNPTLFFKGGVLKRIMRKVMTAGTWQLHPRFLAIAGMSSSRSHKAQRRTMP